MLYSFPSPEWVQAFEAKLNNDERYATVASKWEGDTLFEIGPDPVDESQQTRSIYLDLWHGKCRAAHIVDEDHPLTGVPTFTLSAPLANFAKILEGKLDPMQAMLTRKLRVSGNMVYMMRNVPVVLDFVRCAKEVTLAGLEAEDQ